MAVVAVVESPSDGQEYKLACELPSGVTYDVPSSAAPGNWISEKMRNSELRSKVTELTFPLGTKVHPITGVILISSPPGLVNKKPKQRRRLSAVGTKRVIAVRVFGGTDYPNSADYLSNKVFGTSGDSVNLKSQYASCSYNQLVFEPGVFPNDDDRAEAVGVVNITLSGTGTLRTRLTQAINTKFGVGSPTAVADHFMFCLPSEEISGIAYAYINSWDSYYSRTWCDYPSAQMHEV